MCNLKLSQVGDHLLNELSEVSPYINMHSINPAHQTWNWKQELEI